VKFCKDCLHFRSAGWLGIHIQYAKCASLTVNALHPLYLVTGGVAMHCQTARGSERLCGKDAKHFEAKA
jgi:hypothetical protein